MARLLEALKEKGIEITPEVEQELLKEFAEKKDLDLKETEINELKNQITKRDTDIEELKKANPEELQQKLTDLESKYAEDTKNLSESLNAEKINGALKLLLSESGTKDVDVLAGLINREQLKFNNEGKLEGITEQLDSLKKDKAFLFNEASADKPPTYQYKPGVTEDKPANEAITLKEGVAAALGL